MRRYHLVLWSIDGAVTVSRGGFKDDHAALTFAARRLRQAKQATPPGIAIGVGRGKETAVHWLGAHHIEPSGDLVFEQHSPYARFG